MPFDRERYVRRLNVLGLDAGKVGRNDPCPCGREGVDGFLPGNRGRQQPSKSKTRMWEGRIVR